MQLVKKKNELSGADTKESPPNREIYYLRSLRR